MMDRKAEETDLREGGVMDTKGHCFLCLDKIINGVANICKDKHLNNLDDTHQQQPLPLNIYSIQCLSHYLGMITTLTGNNPTTSSKLKVTLCQRCGPLSDQFTKKYEQLHKIQMELLFSLELIYEKLVLAGATGKTEKFRKLMDLSSKTGDGCKMGRKDEKEELKYIEGLRLKYIEGLRLEAMQKCSKLKQLPPRVKVLSMSAKQIRSAKKLLHLKLKAKKTSTLKAEGHTTTKTTGTPTGEDKHKRIEIGHSDVQSETSFANSVYDGDYDDGDYNDDVYENADHRKAITETSNEVDHTPIPSCNHEDPTLSQLLIDNEYDACQRKMFKLSTKLFGPSFKPPTKQEILNRKQDFLKKGIAQTERSLEMSKRRAKESEHDKRRNIEQNIYLTKDVNRINQIKKIGKTSVKPVRTSTSHPHGRPRSKKNGAKIGRLDPVSVRNGFEAVVFDMNRDKYKCHLCPKREYSSHDFLRRHYQNHHSIKTLKRHDKLKHGAGNPPAHNGVGSKLEGSSSSPHNMNKNGDKQQELEQPQSSTKMSTNLRADQDFEVADITKVKVEPGTSAEFSSKQVNYERFEASAPGLPPSSEKIDFKVPHLQSLGVHDQPWKTSALLEPSCEMEVDSQIEIGPVKLERGFSNFTNNNDKGEDSDSDKDDDFRSNFTRKSSIKIKLLPKARKSQTTISKICTRISNTNKFKCRLCPMIFQTFCGASKHYRCQHKTKHKQLHAFAMKQVCLKSISKQPTQKRKPNDKKPSADSLGEGVVNGHSKTNQLSRLKLIANSIVKSRQEPFSGPVRAEIKKVTRTKDITNDPPRLIDSSMLSAKFDMSVAAVMKSKSESQEETFSNISQKPFTKNVKTGHYHCNFCCSVFSNYQDFRTHLHTDHEKDKFRCKSCPLKFEKHNQLHQHVNSMHLKRYTCKLCEKEFPNRFTFTYHEQSVHQYFKCESCYNYFNTKCTLLQHQITTGCGKGANPKLIHSCGHCENTFTLFEEIQEHWRTVHFTGAGGEFGCDLCGKMFMWAQPLTKHKESVHGIVTQKGSES